MVDPALPVGLGRALYYSVKRRVNSIVRISADAKFMNIAGELSRRSGVERQELEAAFEEMKQLVAIGEAKGMDEEARLAFIDRWTVSRRKPGFLPKLKEEMQAWKPLNPLQRQARSALRAQKEAVEKLYGDKAAALEELHELQAKAGTTRLTPEEVTEERELQTELNRLDPQVLGDPRELARTGRGQIHGAEVTLEAMERDAARAELSLYDRLRAVAPSDRASDRCCRG